MARLPIIGSDDDKWGEVLNEFLLISHQPNGSLRNTQKVFNVRDYGAKGDGITPDHSAIQQAINDAGTNGGGIVWLPPGRYLIDERITINQQIILMGSGWSSKDTTRGSWIYVRNEPVNIEIRGQGTIVSDLGIYHNQPEPTSSGWQPRNYYHAIHAAVDDIAIRNVHLFNATNGILIEHHSGGAIGRVTLDRIWGQPLHEGVTIENARDVVKVNNVHFWRFWTENISGGGFVNSWIAQNGVAIRSLRADNPQFSGVFALGYSRGFSFGASNNGPTSKFQIMGADCDSCDIGIEVGGVNATGSIVNFNSQGSPGNVGINIIDPGIRVYATNFRLTSYRANGVRATGNNTKVFLQSGWLEAWNRSGSGFPAIEAVDDAQIYVGRPMFFDKGNNGPLWGGTNGGRIFTDFADLVSTFLLDQ